MALLLWALCIVPQSVARDMDNDMPVRLACRLSFVLLMEQLLYSFWPCWLIDRQAFLLNLAISGEVSGAVVWKVLL